MPSIERADPIILGHILAEHRDLHDHLTAIRCGLAGAPTPTATAAVRTRLQALHDHLRRHFTQEEEGGFLEESTTRVPRLARAMRAVLAEHPALLAELEGLIEGLSSPDIAPASWEQADRDFAAFAQHLLAHERNENAVVQEGYNEDLGLTD